MCPIVLSHLLLQIRSEDFFRTLLMGGEPNSGMDCLQLRQSAGPFHYLISEQAKSLVALQELQHEVGALLEFRDLVIETFPNLRSKMAASSSPTTMTTHSSNIPVAVRRDWEPGVRVRRKLNNKDDSRSKKTESTIQDSGFSTETSSKETHSASSTAMTTSAPSGAAEVDEAEDELWNLLDVIHRKGTRLKDEVEALQGAIRDQNNLQEESNFQRTLFTASADDVRQLKRERDHLLDRVAEMEAEVLASRVHTSRLQEDLEHLLGTKHDLEEQLKTIMSARGEVNSRIRDLHLQFVADDWSDDEVADVGVKVKGEGARSKEHPPSSHKTPRRKRPDSGGGSELDRVLGEEVPRVRTPNSKQFAAILQEQDPLVLQKHLLTTTVRNQVLQEKLESACKKEEGLTDELDKAREENEELKFQLEDKNIELEGTRARVRVLEQLQKPPASVPSPDVIPVSQSPPLDHGLTRSEITTASMKAMSPFPLTLDHSSSTESAHDQAESTRTGDQKRKPSKIPLVKSYAAPKPPGNGGKHSPAPTHARSRSGESPGRPHSAQSWRNKSEGNSLSGSKSSGSLSKSRNGSLTAAKDSLTGKLRSNDSLSKLRDSPANSFGPGRNTLLRKGSSAAVRRNSSVRDTPDSKMVLHSTKEKSQSQWILSSYNSCELEYPDSLNETASAPGQTTTESSSGQNYQSANNFLWATAASCNDEGNCLTTRFYDSIDSNLASSLYQQNGEDLADCDSLEKQLSDCSDRK